MLTKANKISSLEINCFVDASSIATHAIISNENKNYLDLLSKEIKFLDKLSPDKTILLVSSKEKI